MLWAVRAYCSKWLTGEKQEPYELLTVDVEEEHQGAVMEELGRRKGDLQDMQPDGKGRVRLEYRIPGPRPHRLSVDVHDDVPRHGIMSHVILTTTVPSSRVTSVNALGRDHQPG